MHEAVAAPTATLGAPSPALFVCNHPMSDSPTTDFSRPGVRAISLRELPWGQPARVVQLSGRPEHVHRLMEFGVRPGCYFELVRGGNPCIVRMDGTRFCLRTGRRLDVLVEPLEGAPGAIDEERRSNCEAPAPDRMVLGETVGQ